ncbi:hypothetical protein C8T65DRAFT_744854 [Cerioporus squamosus]|nr:hypothetical protein C8T65DRAFT_744854 [Cerioporus squamosus]
MLYYATSHRWMTTSDARLTSGGDNMSAGSYLLPSHLPSPPDRGSPHPHRLVGVRSHGELVPGRTSEVSHPVLNFAVLSLQVLPSLPRPSFCTLCGQIDFRGDGRPPSSSERLRDESADAHLAQSCLAVAGA